MNCVVFGYGYMGAIRYSVLRQNPDVKEIIVVDPQIDSKHNEIDGLVLAKSSEVPWDRVDIAFICTPNHVTADLCVESLKNCGNVFCEKPPGRNWEDFCKIADGAASVPNHRLVFGFNHRLHPSIQAAKTLIGEGGLGNILYVKGTYGKSGGSQYKESWRNNKELSGGGILLDQGIHMLDIFSVFLGNLTLRDAILVDSFWKCGVEDNAFVLLESQEGTPAFLHSSATLWKHTFRIEIGCQHGYLFASGFLSKTGSYGREQLVIGRRQFENEALALGNPREEIIHFDRDESWDREVNDFINAIKNGTSPPHGTLQEAQRVMEIIREAYALNKNQTRNRTV